MLIEIEDLRLIKVKAIINESLSPGEAIIYLSMEDYIRATEGVFNE